MRSMKSLRASSSPRAPADRDMWLKSSPPPTNSIIINIDLPSWEICRLSTLERCVCVCVCVCVCGGAVGGRKNEGGWKGEVGIYKHLRVTTQHTQQCTNTGRVVRHHRTPIA